MEKNMKPKIRFKGYTDPWEQRKFSEITFLAGKKNKDNLSLESYSITNEKGFIPQNEQFENGGTMIEADKRMYYIVTPNTFAYNPARINVGSIGYYDKQVNIIVSSLYEVFKTTHEVYARFLWHWFKTHIFQRCIEQLQEGGVRLYFYYDKLCQSSIALPNYSEQVSIANQLDKIDTLITLHQRKCEKLKEVKKALLQKMFPSKGENIPKIRFKGYTDPWEQHKFENMFTYLPNNSLSRSELSYDLGELHSVHYGDVLIKYSEILNCDVDSIPKVIDPNKIKNIQAALLQDGDIVIADAAEDSTVGKCSEIRNSRNKKIVSGLHTIPVRPCNKYAMGFLAYSMNSPSYHNQLLPLMQGTKVSSLSKSVLKDTTLLTPSTNGEQEKIGNTFLHLDTLITLHQRKDKNEII